MKLSEYKQITGVRAAETEANDEVGKLASFLRPALPTSVVSPPFAVSQCKAALSNLSFEWGTKRKGRLLSLFLALSHPAETLHRALTSHDFIDREVSPLAHSFRREFSKKGRESEKKQIAPGLGTGLYGRRNSFRTFHMQARCERDGRNFGNTPLIPDTCAGGL